MSRFRDIFPAGHEVLPLIAVALLSQALRKTGVVREAGGRWRLPEQSWVALLNFHSAVAEALLGWHSSTSVWVARLASGLMDVVTTSGTGPSHAADLAK